MAEIEEVPIADAAESAPVEAEPAVVEDLAEPAPKKRGRPPGSKNKPKAAAKEARPAPAREASPPKRSAKRGSGAAEKRQAVPESESEEEPPPPKKRRARSAAPEVPSQDSVSPEMNTRAIAAEVLHLLSNRHVERAAAKREKYRSWFQ